MRRRPRRADGRGDGGACREAEASYAREEIVAKICFAAEEVRAAADVEQNAVRRIRGDQRCVALAPVGKGSEQARVGCAVFRHGGESGMHGARLGEREAAAHTKAFRRAVDRGEKIEIAAPAVNDEGERCTARIMPLLRDTVGRKPLEPKAQNALRARNAAPHCSTPQSMLRDDHGGCA